MIFESNHYIPDCTSLYFEPITRFMVSSLTNGFFFILFRALIEFERSLRSRSNKMCLINYFKIRIKRLSFVNEVIGQSSFRWRYRDIVIIVIVKCMYLLHFLFLSKKKKIHLDTKMYHLIQKCIN